MSREVQHLFSNKRVLERISSDALHNTFVSLVFRVQPFSLPTAVPQKVKVFEDEWKEKMKKSERSMFVRSVDKSLSTENQYINIDDLIDRINKRKQQYISYRPTAS
ncbi:hypothetical protein KA013_02920 [Patescibacteria group bacterium]|nr:hypothetical protein [Patescibacteria group bacterium]